MFTILLKNETFIVSINLAEGFLTTFNFTRQ